MLYVVHAALHEAVARGALGEGEPPVMGAVFKRDAWRIEIRLPVARVQRSYRDEIEL